MKLSGKNDDEIWDTFQVDTPMKVFSWKGDIDTIMKPIDSIRYYKFHLRASMMSMEPQTGHVKAWVGGFNYKHFQYDQVKQGRRQIGSTFKPFLYATAIDQLKTFPLLYCSRCSLLHRTNEAWKYGCLVSIKFK
jgi:penicillin-binding protein 1A